VNDNLIAQIRDRAKPLRSEADLDPLMDRIGDARIVLLGEASHGTHEFYTWRAAITRRLIKEKGFRFMGVEGDWPDCYRVNRYVKGYPDPGDSAREVLHDFERWPTWVWANEEIVELAEWLHAHNQGQPKDRRVGFYGLDVYSLWDSLYQVLGYLKRHDGAAFEKAVGALHCFEPYGEDAHEYARSTAWVPEGCEREVVELLQAFQREAQGRIRQDKEEAFVAEQNALVLRNAEAYYRTAVRNNDESWNVRDRHMAETLERLLKHHGPDAKAIVWEHNTHIGDARYTDMAAAGMVNIGQLAREQYGEQNVVLVGFGSYQGSVIAATAWEAEMEQMRVPPAREDSWEDALHRAGGSDKLLLLEGDLAGPDWQGWRGHRAIGVVYHPGYESYGNYVPTVLPRRYDAFLYIDRTEALKPLHVPAHFTGELPETYPTGV